MNTKEKILACAEQLIQLNGYNAFSYKHIADEIGIKTSSIHYHFESKEMLANEVIGFHLNKLLGVVQQLDQNCALDSKDKLLQAMTAIYSITFYDNNKMCLAGMLASDIATLPESIRLRVRDFFDTLKGWMMNELSSRFEEEEARFHSEVILAQLEGALLLARLFRQKEGEASDYLNNVLRYIKRVFDASGQ